MFSQFFRYYKTIFFIPLYFAAISMSHTAHAQITAISAPHLIEIQAPPAQNPYPDASLAPIQVKEAFKTAARTHRKILLDFGANWCPDCRMIAGIFALPDAASWLEEHFVIVPINVERFHTNMELAAQYGVHITAIPTILIVTPQGQVLNKDGLTSLGNARKMSPQAVIDLLTTWYNRG